MRLSLLFAVVALLSGCFGLKLRGAEQRRCSL
jgi:hypothetical protein